MQNSELISRSQLLLQYLLAMDVTTDERETFDRPKDILPEGGEEHSYVTAG